MQVLKTQSSFCFFRSIYLCLFLSIDLWDAAAKKETGYEIRRSGKRTQRAQRVDTLVEAAVAEGAVAEPGVAKAAAGMAQVELAVGCPPAQIKATAKSL